MHTLLFVLVLFVLIFAVLEERKKKHRSKKSPEEASGAAFNDPIMINNLAQIKERVRQYECHCGRPIHYMDQTQLKTIRLRPKIEEHDMQTKLRKAKEMLSKGDRVKFVMQMKGREQAHLELHFEKIRKFLEPLQDVGDLVKAPFREGRSITAIVEPSC